MRRTDRDRRAVLAGALGAAGALALPRTTRAALEHAPRRPRALIQILLDGGIDSILTTDPKTRSQVEPGIDLSYAESQISTFGAVRVGPYLAPLGPMLGRFAILNGVRCDSVAHAIAERLQRQMRRTYIPGAPSLGALVGGQAASRRALDEVCIGYMPPADEVRGPTPRTMYWLNGPHPNMWSELHQLSHDGASAHSVLRALASQRAVASGATERLSIDTTAALIEAMPAQPPPAPTTAKVAACGLSRITAPPAWQSFWNTIPTIVWLLQHRLTSSIFVRGPLNWDTHFDNDEMQLKINANFSLYLTELMTALDTTLAPDGAPVSSEVAIMMAGEIGRFPRLNPFAGKDHLSEMPVLFAGPGIRPGNYGETNQRMLGTPISSATGRPGAPRAAVPTLEDLGATVLQWFGARDPIGLGYVGEPLDFLFS